MILHNVGAFFYDSPFETLVLLMMQIQSDHIQRRLWLLCVGMLVYVGGLDWVISCGFLMLFNLFFVDAYLSQMKLYYI